MTPATARSLLILLAIAVASGRGPNALLAGDDDEPLVPEGSVRKPAADKPDPQVPRADQPAKTAADDELVEALSAKAADKAVADRLEHVIDGMRDAQRRLAGANTGARAVQDQVAKDLAALIDELQNQSQNSSESSAQAQSGQKKAPRGGRGAARQRMAAAQQQIQRQSAAAAQAEAAAELNKRRQEGKSKDTSELKDRQAAAEQAEQERRRNAVKDFWGHLPPNVREQLLNINTEKFLPKYEDLVRRYYESLAEKSKKGVTGR